MLGQRAKIVAPGFADVRLERDGTPINSVLLAAMFQVGLFGYLMRIQPKCPKPIVRAPLPDCKITLHAARKAIRENHGDLSSAAVDLGVSRWDLWEFVRGSLELTELVESCRISMLCI